MKPYVVVFAGVPGSSKSIVAYHLSLEFSLPIFSTDNIRYEVKEDLRIDDITKPVALKEYKKRQSERWHALIATKRSFIRDGSVDRTWEEVKADLTSAGYQWFLIDMELSEDFLTNLFRSTGRSKSLEELAAYSQQHQAFMKEFGQDVSVQIADHTFPSRKEIAETALRGFLQGVE